MHRTNTAPILIPSLKQIRTSNAHCSVKCRTQPSYRADLCDAGHGELVDKVVLSPHLAEEEVDLLLAWDVAGADECGVCKEKSDSRGEKGRDVEQLN